MSLTRTLKYGSSWAPGENDGVAGLLLSGPGREEASALVQPAPCVTTLSGELCPTSLPCCSPRAKHKTIMCTHTCMHCCMCQGRDFYQVITTSDLCVCLQVR